MNSHEGPASRTSAPTLPRPANFPEGLIGDIAEFIYRAAPYPNATIALAGAIGFVAGIVGRSYNVNDAGLNEYILVLAPTGAGKEAIADGIARLIGAVQTNVPSAKDFRGPGELVSAPGLFKWLARLPNPVMFSIIGEFGLMLKTMAGPNPSPNMAGLQRVLLQLYSKSGRAGSFDPAAYSDRENNTGIIQSPSLTIIGEGVPETFYGALDETMIQTGLLPRFLTFESTQPRPYQNRHRQIEPSPQLIRSLSALIAQTLLIASGSAGNQVCHVGMTSDAEARFVEFEQWTTDQVNGAPNEATRELWNRANLKALKLAGIAAVARDPHRPLLTLADCEWATGVVHDQTCALIAKFEDGETGNVAGNEVKQQNAVLRCVFEYVSQPFERFEKYGVTAPMHRDGVFTQSYLSRRLIKLPTFESDRIGATAALHRVMRNLAEGDDVREVPTSQMIERYKVKPKAFAVSNPQRFIDVGRKKYGGGI